MSPLTETFYWSLHFSEKDAQRHSEQFPGSGALRSLFWCPIVKKTLIAKHVPDLPKMGRTAPAEGRQNLASPRPNVRRDKISRSGEPLTLIYLMFYENIAASLISIFLGCSPDQDRIWNHPHAQNPYPNLPESISDNPKSALGWPSHFAYFLKFHFFTFEHFLKRGEQCRVSGASTQRKK